jgi:hypothetical protein
MSVLLDVGEANLDFDDLFATIQERVQKLRIEVRAASFPQQVEAAAVAARRSRVLA